MTTEPKLPPQPDIDTDLRDFWCYSSEQAHTYGLQCFEAGRQQGMVQWVSVQERMPPIGVEVLVYSKSPRWHAPHISFDIWDEQHEAPVSFSSATIPVGLGWNDHDDFESVTHWMPLPAPPKA